MIIINLINSNEPKLMSKTVSESNIFNLGLLANWRVKTTILEVMKLVNISLLMRSYIVDAF